MTTHPSYSTIDHTYFDITGTLPSLQQPFFSGHFLVQDARYDGRPNAYFKEHGYLNITLSGTAVFYHDTASVVLNAGKTFLYKWEDPRMHIAYNQQNRQPWEAINLIFKGKTAIDILHDINARYGYHFDLQLESPAIQRLLFYCKNKAHRVTLSASEAAQCVFNLLQTITHSAEKKHSISLHRDIASRLQTIIDNNPSTHFTVTDIANELGISREYFSRLFVTIQVL